MSRRSGSTIKKLSEKDEKANKSKNPTSSFSISDLLTDKSLMKIGMFVGAAFLGLFGYILFQRSSTDTVHNFMNVDTKLLNQTLSFHNLNAHNSNPYLFYCDRERSTSKTGGAQKSSNPLENLPSILSPLNLQKLSVIHPQLQFAVLNCSQTVTLEAPHKSVSEKFKLKKEMKTLIWAKTPYNNHYFKNIQAKPHHLKDIDSMAKFVNFYLQPNAIPIDSHKQFFKYCAFQKSYTKDMNDINPTCILIFKGDNYQPKLHKELERRLVAAYPQVRFGLVDANKLRLSHDKIATPDGYGIRLQAIRNGSHYLEMVNPSVTWDYLDTFVSEAVSVPFGDYRLGENGHVKLIKAKEMRKRLEAEESKKNKKSKKSAVVEEEEKEEEEEEKEQEQQEEEVMPKGVKKVATKSSKKKKTDAKKPKKSVPKKEEKETDDEDNENEEKEEGTPKQFSKNTPDMSEEEEKELREKQRLERERRIREEMDKKSRDHLYDTSAEEEMEGTYQEMEEGEEDLIEL
jgi:hypothetical protein